MKQEISNNTLKTCKLTILNKTDYISGWEALNIPSENGLIADWHPLHYFNKKTRYKKI